MRRPARGDGRTPGQRHAPDRPEVAATPGAPRGNTRAPRDNAGLPEVHFDYQMFFSTLREFGGHVDAAAAGESAPALHAISPSDVEEARASMREVGARERASAAMREAEAGDYAESAEPLFVELRRAAIAEEGPAATRREEQTGSGFGASDAASHASDRGVLDRRRPRWDTPGFDASAYRAASKIMTVTFDVRDRVDARVVVWP